MLVIRLQRVGRRNDPAYRIVVQDKQRSPKSGRVVEVLGHYNPKLDRVGVDAERATHWIERGATASDTVHNIFVNQGVIKGAKINVLPKKRPIVKEESEVEETKPAEGGEEASASESDAPEDAAESTDATAEEEGGATEDPSDSKDKEEASTEDTEKATAKAASEDAESSSEDTSA